MQSRVLSPLRILVAYVCVLVAACAGTLAQAPGAPPASSSGPKIGPELRISAGDMLEIDIFDAPELSTKARVNASGNIAFPLLGSVNVAGRTGEEIEQVIQKRLVEGGFVRAPHATVTVLEYATQGVSMLGEVNKPGVYPLVGPRTLLDMISLAGGLTDKAGREVTVTHREDGVAHTLLLDKDISSMNAVNVDILPGDTIAVSTAGVVYVVGEVNKPSGIVMNKSDSMSVLKAISMSEGVKPNAALSDARVIRRKGEGTEEIRVSLKRILNGKEPDLALKADDILFVPNSATRAATKKTIETLVQTATGIIIWRR